MSLNPNTRHGEEPLSYAPSPVGSLFNATASMSTPSLSSGPSSFDNIRNHATGEDLSAVKCEVMSNWLHIKQQERRWFSSNTASGEGIVLKKSRGVCVCAPTTLAGSEFEDAVRRLNVRVAMTVNTKLIKILLRHNEGVSFIEVQSGLRVQVLPDITFLPRCQKHQFAAFIANPGLLVVWEDQPYRVVSRIEKLESALVQMVWGSSRKEGDVDADSMTSHGNKDAEAAIESSEKPRRTVFIQPIASAIMLAVAITALTSGWREVAIEMAVNMTFYRILFLLPFLPQLWCSLV
jgi:hypothetical protein